MEAMQRLFRALQDYFLPRETNDYKPHSLRHYSALGLLLAVFLVEALLLTSPLLLSTKDSYLAAVLAPAVVELTNEKRAENNEAPLRVNALLQKAAQAKAEDMAVRGYFSHNDPDGTPPWRWFDEAGYTYSYAGENLAVNFFDSAEVAEAWMASPAHRANIVRHDFSDTGVGVARGSYEGKETVFVVQFFGTPPSAVAAPFVPDDIAVSAPPSEEPSVPVDSRVLAEAITMMPNPSFLARFAASPRATATEALIAIMLFVALALVLAVFVKFRIQHPALIRNGVALLVVISVALWFNEETSHLVVEAPDDLTASAISALR